LTSSFKIENGLKQGDALSPLLFNFALEYAIREVQETNLGLDINGTHQVLAYADDVNLIGDDIRTIERNEDVLLNACKDISLVVNTGKTKYREIGRHRGTNAHIKIGSNCYEKVKTFKYLGSLLTNQNSIQEEIKCRLNAGNPCYFSVQTSLYSRILSKNLKIKICKTIILPVVLCDCETWSLTLREKCRLGVFENRIRGEYVGPRGMRMGSGEGSTMRIFIVCTVHPI